jgi:hypothetical protein
VTPRRRPDVSPFVGAIEPTTESDDEIRAILIHRTLHTACVGAPMVIGTKR